MNEHQRIKYPIGIQSFKEIREGGYLYVDKTAMIARLKEGKYYFLSRPRRFGKSLLLSTLEAYYEGRRDLFRGLALDSMTEDWEPRPVLHLDLNNREYRDETSLEAQLNCYLEQWEVLYGNEKRNKSTEERFAYLIRRAYEQTGKKVVILIDEYDKPLLSTIHLPELAEIYRSQLKAFYGNIKTMDPYIEIAILTGVARFSKVSVFSDLNNLRDISFDEEFASVCGITSTELETYFVEGIHKLAEKKGMTPEAVREELRRRYDGYHFAEVSPDIYNPFSLMNVFGSLDLGDYWFATGTPTYLYRLLRNGHIPYREISPVEIPSDELKTAGLLDSDPVPAFYQTGYLTIKSFDREFDTYILDYPNLEVKRGFLNYLMRESIPEVRMRRGFTIADFVREVRAGNPGGFMRRMESLIASVPYSEKGSPEAHFQNAVYLLFSLIGFYARIEDRTSDGRIDLQVETGDYIYIFEFKIDSSPQAAMDQIRRKRYWLRESSGDRKIYLIGANFDTGTHRLSEPLIETP